MIGEAIVSTRQPQEANSRFKKLRGHVLTVLIGRGIVESEKLSLVALFTMAMFAPF